MFFVYSKFFLSMKTVVICELLKYSQTELFFSSFNLTACLIKQKNVIAILLAFLLETICLPLYVTFLGPEINASAPTTKTTKQSFKNAENCR